MATRPRFSIVIPTCDRPNLLATTLPACLLTERADIEVIVSDNLSAPATAAVVERFRGDRRLRSVRTASRLPMADHWEFASQHAEGDFVIINSDDDVFSPPLLTALDTVARHTPVGLASWDAGLYLHPDWDLSGTNTFEFESTHTGLVFDIDPAPVLDAYARLTVPRCFPLGTRFCFARQLGERIRAQVGRLFWPPFPDYSAPLLLLGLLGAGERYLYLDTVFGYGGRSRNSNAAAFLKDRGRGGNAARARQFFAEHGSQNLFEDLEFGAISLTNGHAQTLALLQRLAPETFGRYELDRVAYIAALECEFRQIGAFNPWFGPDERAAFDRFLARQDPAIVARALRIVEERWRNDAIAEWQKGWRGISWPVVRQLLRPAMLRRGIKKLARPLLSRISPASVPVRRRVADGIRARAHGVMVTVDCASFGGRDGLDLARRLDEIVRLFDRRDPRNLADFFVNGYMVAAHVPALTAEPLSVEALDEDAGTRGAGVG